VLQALMVAGYLRPADRPVNSLVVTFGPTVTVSPFAVISNPVMDDPPLFTGADQRSEALVRAASAFMDREKMLVAGLSGLP